MAMATSLVALALLGSDPAPAPAPMAAPAPASVLLPAPAPMAAPAPAVDPAAAVAAIESGAEIPCRMQMMTVDGLEWRAMAYPRLITVGHKGASTIWTADRSLKAMLKTACEGKSTTVEAPKVTACKDATATIVRRGPFAYIGDVDRIADGPINGATQVAYSPRPATIEVGFTSEHSARRIDQGVLAKVKVAETHIGTMHQIGVSEYVFPPQDEASTATTPAGQKFFQSFVKGDAAKVSAPVMVPEVASCEVAGEWLVPNESILIISLGVDTVTIPAGKTVVQERLAIYDFARPSDEERTAQVRHVATKPFQELVTYEVTPGCNAAMTPACRVDAEPDKSVVMAAIGMSGLSMPRVPDRSLPAAFDSNGDAYELPPLPEAYASADLDRIKPGTPMASPQSQTMVAGAAPAADPALARTSLQPIPDSEIENHNAPAGSVMLATFGGDATPIGDACPGDAPLGAMVEAFLRSGLAAPADCDTPACPAAGCPYSPEGCDEKNQPAPPPAAKVEMGVSVRDGKGLCTYNAEEDIIAALKNPGKTEVKYIPLGDKLTLEIQAKVVASPAPASTMATKTPAAGPVNR